MKKLYIHIGLSKTGTSALQSWLSENNTTLKKQGIDYADLSPAAKRGRTTAGNGSHLYRLLESEKIDEIEQLITKTYFQSNDRAIISSETLQKLSPDSILLLKSICDKHSIDIFIIAYIRSAYELLYSNYLQGVKRNGFTHHFGEKGEISYRSQTIFLKSYHDIFKEKLFVKNYDYEKENIFRSFSQIIGFDHSLTTINHPVVNRSLTFTECETLIKLNRMHGGLFSTEISNFLILKSPSQHTSVYYNNKIIKALEQTCSKDFLWINNTLLNTETALEISLQDQESNKPVCKPHKEDILKIIVQWCLKPKKSDNHPNFTQFLVLLSRHIEHSQPSASLNLLLKAHNLSPEDKGISLILADKKTPLLNKAKILIGSWISKFLYK